MKKRDENEVPKTRDRKGCVREYYSTRKSATTCPMCMLPFAYARALAHHRNPRRGRLPAAASCHAPGLPLTRGLGHHVDGSALEAAVQLHAPGYAVHLGARVGGPAALAGVVALEVVPGACASWEEDQPGRQAHRRHIHKAGCHGSQHHTAPGAQPSQ